MQCLDFIIKAAKYIQIYGKKTSKQTAIATKKFTPRSVCGHGFTTKSSV